MSDFFINKAVREHLAQYHENVLGADFIKEEQRGLEFILDKVIATFDVAKQFKVPFAYGGVVDISGALGTVVPIPSCNPWTEVPTNDRAYYQRLGCAMHVTYMVFDLTTANTQAVMGPSTVKSKCYPLSLPTTNGFEGVVDFWVPPTFYIGLTTTNNGADNAKDLEIYGVYEPLPQGLFDWYGYSIPEETPP